MLKVTMDSMQGQLRLRMSYDCPHCGMMGWCIAEIPLYCQTCFKQLPNISAIIEDENERIAWHRFGITTRMGRVLTTWPQRADEMSGGNNVHSSEEGDGGVHPKHISLVQIYH